MKRALFFLLLAALFSLNGCRPSSKEQISSHMVTEISVECENCNEFTSRYYNSSDKMRIILLYIRGIGPQFSADVDPETLEGPMVSIRMTRSDGSQKIYRQKNDQYFQENGGHWKKISQEWGEGLYRIILDTPSDNIP